MLEDTIAYAQAPYGICSGAATVTMFKSIDLTNITAAKLVQIIANFTNLNAVIFADYLRVICLQPSISKLILSSQPRMRQGLLADIS